MRKSLLDQYPHLKNLLNENREKNSVANSRKKETVSITNKKDISPSVTNKKDTNPTIINKKGINSPSPIKKEKTSSVNRTSGVLHAVDTNVAPPPDNTNVAPPPDNTPHYPTTENLQVLQGKQSILGPGIGTRRPFGSQSSLPVKFPTKQPLR